MRVKCIDPRGFEGDLSYNTVYEVHRITTSLDGAPLYVLKDIPNLKMAADRFEIIDDESQMSLEYPEVLMDPPSASTPSLAEAIAGVKFDDGKIRYDLLPPELLHGVADILTFGAKKYSARNWEKGMDWGRVYGALQRHLWAWWGGEANDPETGKSHLWHAGCCLAFLIAYEQRGVGTDDRP